VNGIHDDRRRTLRTVGLVVVFLWFFIGGIAHFALTDAEIRLVPDYIPWPRAAVLVSGVLELIGAAGLLHPATRRLAGWLLFAVTLGVTPVHIDMLQHADRWPVPYWLLVARLPLQVALLALIVWSTARPSVSPASSRPA
jgi:uncharacterized membrane protein